MKSILLLMVLRGLDYCISRDLQRPYISPAGDGKMSDRRVNTLPVLSACFAISINAALSRRNNGLGSTVTINVVKV